MAACIASESRPENAEIRARVSIDTLCQRFDFKARLHQRLRERSSDV